MAVYKPSQFIPSLDEIDANQNNTFSCQVNTSGNPAKAYKLDILSIDGETTIYDGAATNLSSQVLNKGRLQIPNVSNTTSGMSKLVNGKDYQWGARIYDAIVGSTAQPKTLVCSGYLVGSTRYVLWTTTDYTTTPDALVMDRWIEFNMSNQSNYLPVPIPNPDNMVLPTGAYRERKQISWVENELGWNKNFIKIELEEPFTYNYKDETEFQVYLCSDQHTQTSVFIDPNDVIERGYYIEIYTPDGQTLLETKRKIMGYGESTGEVRVQDPFNSIPVNGQIFKIYSYDYVTATYTEQSFTSSNKVGGAPVAGTFKVVNNRWDSSKKQLFIQPNVNIKTDITNPNEIVFDNNGARVDINKTISTTVVPRKTTDTTFNPLDNSQWLLTSGTSPTSIIPSVSPKSYYKVYSDFMDAFPFSVFYARTTPTRVLQFKNANEMVGVDNPFITVNNDTAINWRDVTFNTTWTQIEGVEVKYYHYYLYDTNGDLVIESDDIYNSIMEWTFRGLTSGTETQPEHYSIKIKIVDQYDKEFTNEASFLVYYEVEQGIIPLDVSLNCDEHGMLVVPQAPVYVLTKDDGNMPTVDSRDLNSIEDYLQIPAGEVLNYVCMDDAEQTPIVITPDFSYFTKFQLTADFLKNIKKNNEETILKIAHATDISTGVAKDSVEYSLKIGGFETFYQDDNGVFHLNPNVGQIKLYKENNVTPIACFDGKSFYDLFENDVDKKLKKPTKVKYALQDASYGAYKSYEYLPRPYAGNLELNTDTIYTALNDSIFSGEIYRAGVLYKWNGGNGYVQVTDSQYVYVETLNQVEGATYDSLGVPETCRSSDNITVGWTEFGTPYTVTAGNKKLRVKVAEATLSLDGRAPKTYSAQELMDRFISNINRLRTIEEKSYDKDDTRIEVNTLNMINSRIRTALGLSLKSSYINAVGGASISSFYSIDNIQGQNDNIWVDCEELIAQNSEYLGTKWFNFYMTVVNNKVSCYISIVNNR